MDINVLTFISAVLVVVGLVMVILQWWVETQRAAREEPFATDSGSIGSAIERLFDLVADAIGDPRRWGFALIGLGLVGLIVDQLLA